MKDRSKPLGNKASRPWSGFKTPPGKASMTSSRYRNVTPPQHYMRKAAATDSVALSASLALDAATGSTGDSLPPEFQGKLERSLGDRDLSGVRIHTSVASAKAADAIAAKAFTTGNDIHFAAGQYDPASKAGQHLLGHEVAHTVQQQGVSRPTPSRVTSDAALFGGLLDAPSVSQPGDTHERQADAFADAFVAGAGQQVDVRAGSAPTNVLARKAQQGGAGQSAPGPTNQPLPPVSKGDSLLLVTLGQAREQLQTVNALLDDFSVSMDEYEPVPSAVVSRVSAHWDEAQRLHQDVLGKALVTGDIAAHTAAEGMRASFAEVRRKIDYTSAVFTVSMRAAADPKSAVALKRRAALKAARQYFGKHRGEFMAAFVGLMDIDLSMVAHPQIQVNGPLGPNLAVEIVGKILHAASPWHLVEFFIGDRLGDVVNQARANRTEFDPAVAADVVNHVKIEARAAVQRVFLAMATPAHRGTVAANELNLQGLDAVVAVVVRDAVTVTAGEEAAPPLPPTNSAVASKAATMALQHIAIHIGTVGLAEDAALLMNKAKDGAHNMAVLTRAETGVLWTIEQRQKLHAKKTEPDPELTAPLVSIMSAYAKAAASSSLAKLHRADRMRDELPAQLMTVLLARCRLMFDDLAGNNAQREKNYVVIAAGYGFNARLNLAQAREQKLRAEVARLRVALSTDPVTAATLIFDLQSKVAALTFQAELAARADIWDALYRLVQDHGDLFPEPAKHDQWNSVGNGIRTDADSFATLWSSWNRIYASKETVDPTGYRMQLATLVSQGALEKNVKMVLAALKDDTGKKQLRELALTVTALVATFYAGGTGALVGGGGTIGNAAARWLTTGPRVWAGALTSGANIAGQALAHGGDLDKYNWGSVGSDYVIGAVSQVIAKSILTKHKVNLFSLSLFKPANLATFSKQQALFALYGITVSAIRSQVDNTGLGKNIKTGYLDSWFAMLKTQALLSFSRTQKGAQVFPLGQDDPKYIVVSKMLGFVQKTAVRQVTGLVPSADKGPGADLAK